MHSRITSVLTALALSVLLVLGGGFLATPAQADFIWESKAAPAASIAKGFPGATPVAKSNQRLAGPYWFYNQAYQSAAAGTYNGAFTYMTIEKPWINSVANGDSHSLTEVAVSQGSGATRQAIEVGFTVDPSVNGGSMEPHLFVGRWLNNSFGGYNSGGWVDNPANPINAGSSLAGLVGTSKSFDIRYTGGSWYAFYDNVALGMFPGSIWSSAGVTFTSATLLQVFGELASWNNTPCGDMGRGILATPNGTMSRTSTWSVMPVGGGAWVAGSLSVLTTPAVPAGVWAIHKYNATHPTGTPSNTQTRYGGPGYDSTGTTGGIQNGC